LGTKAREFPGPGDQTPLNNGIPVAIYAPKGAIRVVEYKDGKIQVRTTYGGTTRDNSVVQSRWIPGMTTSQLTKIAPLIQ
jgi:hypothetical protein